MRREKYIQAARAHLVASATQRRPIDHEPEPPLPFLTLSRQAGAGAHTLAERLVEDLNLRDPSIPWAMFDENLVQEVLRKQDLPAHFGEHMTEDKAPGITELVEVTLGLHPHKDTLVAKVNATILSLARRGHVILVGRGSHLLTRSMSGGLHVRLIGTSEYRRQQFASAHGIDERDADVRIAAIDAGRRAYIKRHFHASLEDDLSYDLVINMANQSIDAVAAMLERRMQARERRAATSVG